jgi:hypothetical protein
MGGGDHLWYGSAAQHVLIVEWSEMHVTRSARFEDILRIHLGNLIKVCGLGLRLGLLVGWLVERLRGW